MLGLSADSVLAGPALMAGPAFLGAVVEFEVDVMLRLAILAQEVIELS
jgi:hypothetical protein